MTDVADQIQPSAPGLPPELQNLGPRGIFLSYQVSATALSRAAELVVIEKSRRIGITWAFAGDDAITAGTRKEDGGDDVLYISYSHDMAREYMDAVATFAKAFMGVDASVGEFLFDDEDPKRPGETRQIKAFRIDFASGNAVQALSSAPRSLRGKQGRVRIDEAAFVDNLDELLKAALALLIWGGQVTVMSTHDGVDNPFNKLIQRIRSGEQAGEVVRITFDDAIAAGLYERVCLRKGETPTPEGKAAWIAKIRALYGSGASEELDVIPSRGGGAWLTHDEVERAERAEPKVLRWELDDAWAKKAEEVRDAEVRLWCLEHLKPLLDRLDQRAAYGLGGDLARYVDLTVLWLLGERQDRSWFTPFVIELRNMPLTAQRQIIRFILDRIRRWSAAIDKGGLGQDTAEQLQQQYGESRVAMVDMNSQFWLTEGPPLKSRFEESRVEIPRDRDVAADLRGIVKVGGTPMVPKTRSRAKGEDAKKGETRHYDAAVGLVLASCALRSGASAPMEVSTAASPVQQTLERAFGGGEERISDAGWGVAVPSDNGPGWA